MAHLESPKKMAGINLYLLEPTDCDMPSTKEHTKDKKREKERNERISRFGLCALVTANKLEEIRNMKFNLKHSLRDQVKQISRDWIKEILIITMEKWLIKQAIYDPF